MGKKIFVKLLFVISLFCAENYCYAQLDTTFWFAAPEVTETPGWGNFDRPIVLRISTLGQPANVSVSIPANNAVVPKTTTIAANSSGTIDLTSWIDLIEAKPPNTILNGGIKLVSTAPVNVYYENISGQNTACQCSPEIFVLKGQNALGKDFIIPSQNILQNGTAYNPPSYNSFDIIATEDNTTVTITPKVAIVGHAAGIPFTVTLNKGQVISNTATNFFPINHLTGSTVVSNKPIAITVKDDMVQGPGCWDLGGDQIIPTDNLSTEYIAIRGYLSSLTDQVFITAVKNNTTVSINGVSYGTINATQTIAVPFSTETMHITASDKVYAFQLSGFGCEIGLSTIPSVKCRGSSSVSFSRSSSADLILLITTRAGNENFFSLNGVPLAASLFAPVSATGNQWVYAKVNIPVSQLAALSAGRLTNSKGLFHLGIIHGSTVSGGARFGYFSDYAAATLNTLKDSITACGLTTQLDAGAGYSNYNWNTGATTPAISITQTGQYKVSVTNVDGCLLSDSAFVKIEPLSSDSSNVSICQGQSYTLPWGTTVNASGIYHDTLKYRSGCDSIRRVINLHLPTVVKDSSSVINCSTQAFTLPWGTTVYKSGIYKDTIRYTGGCDSLIQIINLTLLPEAILDSTSSQICYGSTYTLPWGKVVNTSGIYKDTARYTTGCDSVVTTVNLTVKTASSQIINPVVCEGAAYILPWGVAVSKSGIYRDTLHYSSGCDSLRRIVNLTVQAPQKVTVDPTICEGQKYTLPWGKVVGSSGIYSDTSRYTTGCDSMIVTVNLAVRSAASQITNPVICEGASYTLPWGESVNKSGIYQDTLHYSSGCDSLRRTINLTVQAPQNVNIYPVICEGQTFTFPWGETVSTSGIYSDTIRYLSGCDSLITTYNVFVHGPTYTEIKKSICAGQTFNLPSGRNVSDAGFYIDTVRSLLTGCDSLITRLTLDTNLKPVVTISKTNDINCSLGTTKLNASGGISYQWSPVDGLDNPYSATPLASPTGTTVYHVKITAADGCSAEDSIEIKVNNSPAGINFELPNAFTPNNDGLNDCFGIKKWGYVNRLNFSVYDRWGGLVFQTNNPADCWNGHYKNEKLPSGVYVYMVIANTICGEVYRKGTVALIR